MGYCHVGECPARMHNLHRPELWLGLVSYGWPWASLVESGKLWVSLVSYGRVWLRLVTSGCSLQSCATVCNLDCGLNVRSVECKWGNGECCACAGMIVLVRLWPVCVAHTTCLPGLSRWGKRFQAHITWALSHSLSLPYVFLLSSLSWLPVHLQ